MICVLALLRAAGNRFFPDDGSGRNRPIKGGAPRARTAELIAAELRAVRDQLDRHLASGDLALAGECSFELEQLRIELAALRPQQG